MAAVNDCFTIGSIVLCTTCFNQDVEGEVLAFDHNTKMLILNFDQKECRSKKAEKLSDIYVLNLSLCSNVQVIKECNGNFVEEPQKLNLEQLKIRLRKTVQHRQTWLKSKNADVSPEGQELYRVIAKQFKYSEVAWQGLNIIIFNEVTISPPYRAENVVSTSNNRTLYNYIKKMIVQFVKTQGSQETSPSGTSSASSSSSSSSSSGPSTSVATSTNNAASVSPVSAN